MKKENLSELLLKHTQGKCTPEELNLIDQWYLSGEQNPDDLRLLNTGDRAELEEKMLTAIKTRIASNPADAETVKLTPTRPFFNTLYKIAASVVLVSLMGTAVLFYGDKTPARLENESIASINKINRFVNDSKSVVEQVLSDGSIIKLQPNGSIEFPEIFSKGKREIHLTGEAFFDVAKDKDRPFIISTGDVTIKVLGTSFNVMAYQGAKEITVAVKTGRVSVYAKTGFEVRDQATKKEVILNPNQQVVYNTVEENFSKKLVDEPQIILDKPTLFEMQYDGTPVDKIFRVLEENYGIDIVFDEQIFSACSLTTSMSEEGFYERIEIICQAIGARYEIVDGTIVIDSQGCQ